jgi:hypothetical protein
MIGLVAADTRCPKCRRPRGREEWACARCGLLASRFRRLRAEHAHTHEIDDAWSAALRRWEDPAAHDRVLDLATGLRTLPELARRYRDALDLRPADPTAATRLERIAIAVEEAARIEARNARVGPPRSLRQLSALITVGLLLLAAAMVSTSIYPGLG